MRPVSKSRRLPWEWPNTTEWLCKPVGLIFAFILLVSGCTRHNGSEQARCTIVALGDSLTSGVGQSAEKPYTMFLEETIRAAGHPCVVINEGVPGATTASTIGRISGIVAQHPSVAIVELGGNDGLARRDVGHMEADLGAIVQALASARIRVVLAGVRLPPGFDPAYAERFRQVYPRVAARYHVALVLSVVEGLEQPGLLQDDGIHPTIKGNQKVAKNVETVVLETLSDSATGAPE